MAGATIDELERLYRSRYRVFVRVALAITRDDGLAAEAVQEAFLRSIRGRRRFRGSGSLEAWLWRSVVNEAKRLKSRPRRDDDALGLIEASSNGSADDETALRALIGALPERQRLAVFLRYYADLDYRAIGDVLQVKTGTVSAMLNAAHRSLREAIQTQGVRS
jgi:RNA polymerase sigma factor (sigma-70 family)